MVLFDYCHSRAAQSVICHACRTVLGDWLFAAFTYALYAALLIHSDSADKDVGPAVDFSDWRVGMMLLGVVLTPFINRYFAFAMFSLAQFVSRCIMYLAGGDLIRSSADLRE